MTRRPVRWHAAPALAPLALALASFVLAPAAPAEARWNEAPELRIVVREDNPVTVVTVEELARIFFKKTLHWDDGTPVVPVDQKVESEVRALFSRFVLGRSASSMGNYWQRQIFSGNSTPPNQLSSDLAVLDYVRRNPGAVGYVDAGTPLVHGVRSLKLSDLTTAADLGPMAPGNARLTSAADPSYGSGSQVIAERGDVRILATGACGQNGVGRQVVLQNRSPSKTVRATTEVARWTRGRFDSSSRDRHTLSGHQEKSLGCTHLSDDVELRYAIIRISDNSVEPDPRRGHGLDRQAPARDFIALVETGTCGNKGEGRRVAAVNRHQEREIHVFVERVQKLNGTFKGRSMTSYRLRAGGEKELGCNRQGDLTQEFYLLRTN